MDARSWVVIWLIVVLLVAACAGDEEETPTTGPGRTTTSPSEATSTSGEVTGTTILKTPDGPCFVLRGYIAVQQDGLDGNDAAVAALDAAGVTATPATSQDILGDTPASTELDGVLDFLSVGEENPLAAAQVLIAAPNNINAGPIYATGLAGHWSFKPGTDPIPHAGTLTPPDADVGSAIVAVVDSGLVEPLPQSWMSPEHVLYESPWDLETIGNTIPASHGTFVTSVIRLLAPEHRVAFARARPVPVDQIFENNDPLPSDLEYVSTELHVAEAIVRLLQNDELNTETATALNLSLGAYTCAPDDDPTLITTTAALNLWFAEFPASTVFAAGGNEVYPAPFWPAAMSIYPPSGIDPVRVRGIGAINGDGDQVVWGEAAAAAAVGPVPKPAPNRPWVNNVAPGCNLLGLRGGSETDVVRWSGSSFATAVSAALFAPSFDPVSPPTPTDHDYSTPDLVYDLQGSCDIP
jgi:hypothetical protein